MKAGTDCLILAELRQWGLCAESQDRHSGNVDQPKDQCRGKQWHQAVHEELQKCLSWPLHCGHHRTALFQPLLPLEHTGSYPSPTAASSLPHEFGLSCSGPGFQDVTPTTVAAPSSESLALNAHPLPDRGNQRSDVLGLYWHVRMSFITSLCNHPFWGKAKPQISVKLPQKFWDLGSSPRRASQELDPSWISRLLTPPSFCFLEHYSIFPSHSSAWSTKILSVN